MLKEPRPGRVKTRLGQSLGMTQAAWWYRHQTQSLLRRLRDPRWHLVLAVSPDCEGQASRVWPADLARIPQGGGHLGLRMLRAMRRFDGRVCLIGSDIPSITRGHIAGAFAQLGAEDAVFGPSPDGGYWLIGLKHPGRIALRSFDGVAWSTPMALAQSKASLPGKRIGLAATLQDVDTVDDLP